MYKHEQQKARRKGSGVSGNAGRQGGIHTKLSRAGDLEESGVGEKKVEGLSGKDGLLYHGEVEPISAVAAPNKGSASRRVSKIESQSQPMLRLRREMLS
ncbi:hypothetical protein O181_098231 [Austropuccinia psidii MF-1]|uniref:Uncharacterized protein n=1 Tax=Austropuccinia psidii MF-1 TaxID=1389203 RepID=A0A9Q3PFS5_9BASI|nr:hypothetical protein [Austropuccinia psidii MF-1]